MVNPGLLAAEIYQHDCEFAVRLLEKIPVLSLGWDEEVRKKWLESFEMVMEEVHKTQRPAWVAALAWHEAEVIRLREKLFGEDR